jgi:hypothetical protein
MVFAYLKTKTGQNGVTCNNFISAHQLKKHMDTLRTGFSRANKPVPSGSAPRKSSSRTQYIQKNLVFLAPFVKHRASQSNLDENQEDNEEEEDEDEDENESDDADDNVPLSTLNTSRNEPKTLTVTADVHVNADDTDDDGTRPVPLQDALPDLDTDITRKKPDRSKEVLETINENDIVIVPDNGVDDVPPKRTITKKTSMTPTSAKKKGKNATKRALVVEESLDPTKFFTSMSDTIKDIGNKLITEKPEIKKQKDEISVFIDALEVKLRSIKKRETRLRLIDGIERLTFKYVIDDCIEAESPQTSRSLHSYGQAQYTPTSVVNVSPPQSNVYGQSQSTVNPQLLSSALSQMLGGNFNTLTGQLANIPSQVQNQQMVVPAAFTQMASTSTKSNQPQTEHSATYQALGAKNVNATVTTAANANPIMTTLTFVANDVNSQETTSSILSGTSDNSGESHIMSNIQSPISFNTLP